MSIWLLKFLGEKIQMKMKLFCITYAGGSANAYALWNKHLSDSIELVLVELAGRGKRMGEPFYNDWDEAADDVYCKIMNDLNDDDYAIYGHSMGSWITFEVLRKMAANKNKMPAKVYFSANIPPHVEPTEEKISHLDDEDFIDKIVEMGDTPKEIFSGGLRNFFLPVLRADYKLVEMYKHEEKNISFDFDIHVLYGINDNIDVLNLMKWRKYTKKDFYLQSFNGGHMFFKDNFLEVTDYINSTMMK